VLDYIIVILMDGSRRKKLWMVVSLFSNLFLLAFFKYAGFFTENLNQLLEYLGTGYYLPAPDLLLPVGIRYTFQSMSYCRLLPGGVDRERLGRFAVLCLCCSSWPVN
jgi:D-alanyl-lipoteichoic acid acyltransferase DltB (MBOAT superfamily)